MESASVQKTVALAAAILEGNAYYKQVKIKYEIGKKKPLLNIDTMRLQQIIINLVMNAIKFSHRSGKVEVRVD